MTSITNIWLMFKSNVFEIPIMTNHTHSTDSFDLLKSIPSLISILSYCSIFTLHTNVHLENIEDNIYHIFQKYF